MYQMEYANSSYSLWFEKADGKMELLFELNTPLAMRRVEDTNELLSVAEITCCEVMSLLRQLLIVERPGSFVLEWSDQSLPTVRKARHSRAKKRPSPQLQTKGGSAPFLSPSRAGFPRFWELFPILLPQSVRERVYDPCIEELKEDYLKERKRWKGRFSRRYVAFCFTVKTVALVGRSLWAVLWDATRGFVRKVLFAVLALLFGDGAVAVLRERLVAWFGRLL